MSSIFFRNAIAYRLTQAVEITHDLLAKQAHRQPSARELSTAGFVAPLGAELCLPVACSTCHVTIIAMQTSERMLPASVVRDELKAKIAKIEAEQMRKVYKEERDQLKDDIIQSLLPQAFIRHKVIRAAIIGSLILVETTSSKQAEKLLTLLREALGSLPCRPVNVKQAPVASFTEWLKADSIGRDFNLLHDCELVGLDDGKVKINRLDLTSEEVQNHLATGKLVTKLALSWGDKLSFVLDDKLTLRRIRFDDLLQEQAEQDGGDDQAGQVIASYAIMAGTFAELFADLLDVLGGEDVPEGI